MFRCVNKKQFNRKWLLIQVERLCPQCSGEVTQIHTRRRVSLQLSAVVLKCVHEYFSQCTQLAIIRICVHACVRGWLMPAWDHTFVYEKHNFPSLLSQPCSDKQWIRLNVMKQSIISDSGSYRIMGYVIRRYRIMWQPFSCVPTCADQYISSKSTHILRLGRYRSVLTVLLYRQHWCCWSWITIYKGKW